MAQYLRSVRSHEMQPRERLFLEVGGGGFPMQRTAAHATAFSERHHRARSAATLANSPAARAGQHVATSHVVPAHQVSLDCVPPERHCHRIVDMSGRNVSVRVHAPQSLNQSLFERVYNIVAARRSEDTDHGKFVFQPACAAWQ